MKQRTVKTFDKRHAQKIMQRFKAQTISTESKEFENACMPIAYEILKQHEGFQDIQDVPSGRARPCDLFGYKNQNPYMIEVKSSLKRFQPVGDVQKRYLQMLLDRIDGLHLAVLQIKINTNEYRIWYDEDVIQHLFSPKSISLEPLITWIEAQMTNDSTSER